MLLSRIRLQVLPFACVSGPSPDLAPAPSFDLRGPAPGPSGPRLLSFPGSRLPVPPLPAGSAPPLGLFASGTFDAGPFPLGPEEVGCPPWLFLRFALPLTHRTVVVLQAVRAPTFADLRLALLFPAGPAPPSRVDPAAASAVRARGLARASDLMQHALADSTQRKQQAAAHELASWLVESGQDCDLSHCAPEDVLVYLMEGWLPRHRGRGGPNKAVGPSAVKSHLSLLSGFFSRLGREGRYSSATGLGNPCESVWVDDFRKAYQRLSMLGGYVELSAVPLSEQAYLALVDHLWVACGSSLANLDRLVVLRDLLCALFLWQTSTRGHDTGKLAVADFVSAENPRDPFVGFPLPPPMLWPAGEPGPVLCVSMHGTKASRCERAPPVYLRPNPSQPALCFPRTLALYMWLASLPDAPPGSAVTGFLFRPLRPDHLGFKDEALSSSALGSRMRLHLMRCGAYHGETNHSFRRGSLQHSAAAGADMAALHAQGQIKTPAILKRYLDPSRHEAPRQVVARP